MCNGPGRHGLNGHDDRQLFGLLGIAACPSVPPFDGKKANLLSRRPHEARPILHNCPRVSRAIPSQPRAARLMYSASRMLATYGRTVCPLSALRCTGRDHTSILRAIRAPHGVSGFILRFGMVPRGSRRHYALFACVPPLCAVQPLFLRRRIYLASGTEQGASICNSAFRTDFVVVVFAREHSGLFTLV